jgi:hypothetical protein
MEENISVQDGVNKLHMVTNKQTLVIYIFMNIWHLHF